MKHHLSSAMTRAVPVLTEPLEQRVMLAAVPVGPDFLVNTYTTSHQLWAQVGMEADGDFVVAWTSYEQDGDRDGIYAQRYAAQGVPLGGEFRVNSYTTGFQRRPAVAIDADGDSVIAWAGSGADDFGGVFAQRYDASGIPRGSEFRVNATTTNAQGHPSVAMDADGDFVITWHWRYTDAGPYGVYAQRYNAAGIPQGNEFHVNTYTTGEQANPSVAMDAHGNFVIAWSGAGTGDSIGVFARRYNAAGVPQGTEFHVNTYTTNAQAAPSVAMDADGDFVITWFSEGQDGSGEGVYAQRFNAVGVPQGDEFRVNTYTPSGQFGQMIAMDTDGHYVITWASRDGQDGNGEGVYAQRFNAAGVPQGDEFRVNTFTTGDQRAPAIGMDADGDFVITWQSVGQDGSVEGIYAQRYAIVPEVTASSFHFATAPHRIEFTLDEDVSASLGIEDLILLNLTTTEPIPSADLLLGYDVATNTASFTYTGPGGVLPEGNYRATLLAAGVTTPNGNPLPADRSFEFHFLRGDANNDRRVNLLDFNRLAANFGQSPRDFTQGDFNYDGIVNLSDFNILAGRFGTALSPRTTNGLQQGDEDDLEEVLR